MTSLDVAMVIVFLVVPLAPLIVTWIFWRYGK